MKKKITIIFSMIVFMLFSFAGCSNNSISKIEILDNGIKTNYIVGENVEIDEFSLKITHKNSKEKIYNITEEMLTISEIDNTVVGNQNVNILIDYNGMEIELVVSLSFGLPEEVKAIITLINQLPNKESITLSNEDNIELIESKYSELDNFYKDYISNYDTYIELKEEFYVLKQQFITPEFINERFTLKTNLDNLLYSLNEKNYDAESWEEILKIYDEGIRELYINANYENIENIANVTAFKIKAVKTVNQKHAEILKIARKESLIEYRNTLNSVNYSQDNYRLLDVIINEFAIDVEKLNTVEEIEGLYNEALKSLGEVHTIADEKIISLNYIKKENISSVKNIVLDLDMNNYSSDNRALIMQYYNECIENINNSTDEVMINNEIKIFEYKASKIKTIAEEEKELLSKKKVETINEINLYMRDINIYSYDSQNRILIENSVNETFTKIENAKSISEVDSIKKNMISAINAIPTMVEQAIQNLPNKINSAINQLEEYLNSLDSNAYSTERWNEIVSIIEEGKQYMSENIDITTSNSTINNRINSIKNEIDEILTVSEEKTKLLEDARDTAIKQLADYYKYLNKNDFETDIIEVVYSRISDGQNMIRRSNNINDIEKIVNDTINAVEDAKK